MYGPVRTVVWQGSVGHRRPYADQTGHSEVVPLDVWDQFGNIWQQLMGCNSIPIARSKDSHRKPFSFELAPVQHSAARCMAQLKRV